MIATEPHHIVSHAEWLAARQKHLKREKELTRLRDELLAERRELPWERVEKRYVFDAPEGKKTLADLFAGRSQLIVYHFMLGPGWEEGCKSCSFVADHVEGARIHFEQHDVSYAAVSRAPLAEIEKFKRRMGWRFVWVSAANNEFNFDYHVSFRPEEIASGRRYYNYEKREMPKDVPEELPGASVFFKDEKGDIFHTYSAYARGLDILLGTHNYLDLTPRGRNEGEGMDWVRHHDRYGKDAR